MSSNRNNNKKVEKPKGQVARVPPPRPFPSLNPRGFPQPTFTTPYLRRTLRYCAAVAQTATTGALGISYYRALSLFAPGVVAGHQPLGFDQLMIMYNKYTVLKSKITCDVIVQTVPQVVGIQLLKGTSTAYANYTGIIENGLSTSRCLPASLSVPFRLELSQDTRQSMGVVDPLDDDELSGTSSTDPADPLMFALYNQDINLSSTGTVQFLFTIEYDTVFSEPRQALQS